MSKSNESRRFFWRIVARRSRKQATKPRSSPAWKGMAAFAEYMHFRSIGKQNYRVLWRGKLRPGETIVLRSDRDAPDNDGDR